MKEKQGKAQPGPLACGALAECMSFLSKETIGNSFKGFPEDMKRKTG